jgi:hypothetical protein
MTTPNSPNELTPDGLANQLFDAAITQAFAQNQNDPREAARRVIIFLTEAIVYAISATAGDDEARKALLKNVGETIISAPALPGRSGNKPPAPAPAAPPAAKP